MPRISHSTTFFCRAILCSLALLFSGCALFEDGSNLSNFHTVIIDPGHGGYDHGARAVHGQDEKMLTLDTALRLKPLLQAKGYHVIMTRMNDVFIPLGGRAAISNAHPDAIFVSIHYNCSPSHAASGIETYYYNPASRRLADAIFRELLPVYRGHPRGVKHACYYVLHHNRRPAVLLELGFISNSRENGILQDPSTRQHLAEHIAAGITNARNY